MAEEAIPDHSEYIERVLKAGYFELMLERSGLVQDIGACLTPGSAYLLHLEERYLTTPEKLELENLLMKIHPDHIERIKRIREAAKRKGRDVKVNLANLKGHWQNAPKISDTDVEQVLTETGTRIREQFEGALAAILATPPEHQEDQAEPEPGELEKWQNTDKRLREGIYKLDKDYLAALRNYYEALLERPPGDKSKSAPEKFTDYVLQVPYDDPLRLEIMKEIRYLRLIDAVHQAIAIAKAAHHIQSSGRVRETGNIPYVYHPIAVMNDTILDAIVYFIEEKKLPLDFIMLVVAAALHDLLEDSGKTLDHIVDFFGSRADKYDSSIPIESGYGVPDEVIQRKVLNLFGSSTKANMRKILHILSGNSDLTNDEKIAAINKNGAGKQETRKLLGIPIEDMNAWQGALHEGLQEEPSLKVFREFPKEPRIGKISTFLIRMSGILKGDRDEIKKIGQAALILKIEDRRHNISTMEAKSLEQKLGQLRETIARLIGYAMLDHDQEGYPLYNALPHLIDTTLEQYTSVLEEPEAAILLTDDDRTYLDRLQKWQKNVRRYPIPQDIAEVLERYNQHRITITDTELEAVCEGRRGLLGLLRKLGDVFKA